MMTQLLPLCTPLSAGLTALTAFTAAWWWLALRAWPRGDDRQTAIEQRRRQQVRNDSVMFRTFEPLVLPWARRLADDPGGAHSRLARVSRCLLVQGSEHWEAAEWWMVRKVEAVWVGLLMGLALFVGGCGLQASLLAGVGAMCYFPAFALATEEKKAALYRRKVVVKLPFALDLMALMQEAGAGTFQECIRTIRMELPDTPIGREFALLDARISQGTSQTETMNELARRMDDNDIENMVLAVNTAEEKGSRLRDVLRNLAEQMRLRKIQWLEKSAEQAKVHITWPALSVVVGCMILVTGLVVLNAVIPPKQDPASEVSIMETSQLSR